MKLDRAKAHFEALKRDVDAFLGQPHPYRASIKFDTKASEYRLIGHVDRDAPPELGPVIGDFLFNLRSTLDHLAWELVRANGQTPDKRTEFPIFLARDDFHATIKKDLLHRRSWPTKQEARTAIFDYIESFYNRERRHSTIDYLSPDNYERRFIEENAEAA